jgi:ribosomal protein L37AE/L43A
MEALIKPLEIETEIHDLICPHCSKKTIKVTIVGVYMPKFRCTECGANWDGADEWYYTNEHPRDDYDDY